MSETPSRNPRWIQVRFPSLRASLVELVLLAAQKMPRVRISEIGEQARRELAQLVPEGRLRVQPVDHRTRGPAPAAS
jgi:hypothetical protein